MWVSPAVTTYHCLSEATALGAASLPVPPREGVGAVDDKYPVSVFPFATAARSAVRVFSFLRVVSIKLFQLFFESTWSWNFASLTPGQSMPSPYPAGECSCGRARAHTWNAAFVHSRSRSRRHRRRRGPPWLAQAASEAYDDEPCSPPGFRRQSVLNMGQELLRMNEDPGPSGAAVRFLCRRWYFVTGSGLKAEKSALVA